MLVFERKKKSFDRRQLSILFCCYKAKLFVVVVFFLIAIFEVFFIQTHCSIILRSLCLMQVNQENSAILYDYELLQTFLLDWKIWYKGKNQHGKLTISFPTLYFFWLVLVLWTPVVLSIITAL